MADYIERETAIQTIKLYAYRAIAEGKENLDVVNDIICMCGEIKARPAADVVPVVRCKDCKHLRVCNQDDLYAFCLKTNLSFLPFELDARIHFCRYGERKDGADNA